MLLEVKSGKPHKVGLHLNATEFLGTGRFAEVYRAFDMHLQTDVAVKIYKDSTPRGFEMAKSEHAALHKVEELQSEYFPKVRPFFKTRIQNANHPVLIMDLGVYVGEDSKTQIASLGALLLKTAKVPEFWRGARPYEWILDLFSAVQALHSKGIIHRDLKPSNILLKRVAGAERAVPFVLDFNTSGRVDAANWSGGTLNYLPPEVRARKRIEPTTADDLWAASMVAWEVLHGEGAKGDAPNSQLSQPPSAQVVAVLNRALAIDAATRFGTAEELFEAFQSALRPDPPRKDVAPAITPAELIWARERSSRLLDMALEDLSGEDELPVPKDVQARVADMYSSFAASDTRSFSINEDLMDLGPRAIPAVLGDAHRLEPGSDDAETVVEALAALAASDRTLASRSISAYAVSSNYGVRYMCWRLCELLGAFPEDLLDLLRNDGGLLLPFERVWLADLCIDFSTDPSAFMALTKYMCREYLIDQDRYLELKHRIAERIGHLPFVNKALLVAQDAEQQIWEELPEYERLPERKRGDVSRGIVQLLGDAFASMGEEALRALQNGDVPSRCAEGPLRIFRVFAVKLARMHPPARAWLEQMQAAPINVDIRDVRDALAKLEQPAQPDVNSNFERYLRDGNRAAFNNLCFNPASIAEVGRTLRSKPSRDVLVRVLALLKGFESRARGSVITVAMDFWETLAEVDHGQLVEVVTRFRGPPELRNRLRDLLSADLKVESRRAHARDGLQRLLEG